MKKSNSTLMAKPSFLRLVITIAIATVLLISLASRAQDAKIVTGGVNAADTVKALLLQSTGSGVKFPDNTVQPSAAGILRTPTGTAVVNNLGGGNSSAAAVSLIGSGQNNVINGNADFGIILGGKNNTIENQSLNYSSSIPAPVNPGSHNFISSGEFNTIKPEANHAAIIGGRNNTIATGAVNSIILGGSNISATEPNTVYMQKAAVIGLAGIGDRQVTVDANGKLKAGDPIPLYTCGKPWCTNGNGVAQGNGTPFDFLGTIDARDLVIRTFSSNPNDLKGGERMRIMANGKIGIGTDDPSSVFEVRTGGQANEIVTTFSENTSRKLFVVPHLSPAGYNPLALDGDMGIFWSDGQDGTGGKNSSVGAGLILAPWSTSSYGIRIDANGSLGIGTPAISLAPNGSPTPGGGVALRYATARLDIRGVGNTNSTASLNIAGNNGNSIFIVRDGGNVGIGTNLSDANHIARVEIKGSGSTGSTASLNISDDAGNSIFKVKDDGKVSIGVPDAKLTTSNGNWKLFVAGGIITESSRVALVNTSYWGDWVFDKSNKRMSFAEQLEYYNSNKHLKGIPSSNELKSAGIDVADMFAEIVINLEEAKLDIIKVHQENEELKNELKILIKQYEYLQKNSMQNK